MSILFKGTQGLVDDHNALDQLLKRLKDALKRPEVPAIHAMLDLFWARLAVHIRAEHLHLFRELLKRVPGIADGSRLTLMETRAVIKRLRSDHDFFMNELAGAVKTTRTLLNESDRVVIETGLNAVTDTIATVEQRLIEHNRIEETGIYRWVALVFNTKEQAELAARMNSELEKRPPRFKANVWQD
jgi:hypothetical protein